MPRSSPFVAPGTVKAVAEDGANAEHAHME